MRIFTLLSLALLCQTALFAQIAPLPYWNPVPSLDQSVNRTAPNPLVPQVQEREGGSPSAEAPGDTVWFEDFDWSGTWPTGWTNNLIFGPGSGFVWSTTGPTGGFSQPVTEKIQSTTNGNGFLILRSDSANSPTMIGNITANVTTPALPNLTGIPALHIQLEQHFRWNTTFGTTILQLQVSDNDFINTTPGNLATFDLRNNVPVNIASDNPLVMSKLMVDLSNMTNPGNVKLRILWQNGAYYHYQIDDILVTEAPPTDLAMNEILYNGTTDASQFELYYTQMPLRQFREDSMLLGGELTNVGFQAQSQVRIESTVSGPGINYTGFSPSGSVGIAGNTTLADTNWFKPGANADLGIYNFEFEATSQIAADFDTSDNVLAGVPIECTGSSYARDNDNILFLRQRTPIGLVGNVFEMHEDDTVTAITYYVGNTGQSSSVGSIVRCHLYSLPTFALLASSDSITVTNGNVASLNTVLLDSNVAVSAGDRVIAAFESLSGNPWIGIDPDRVPPTGTTYENFGAVNGQGGFWINNFFNATPYIRLRTKPDAQLCDSANITQLSGGEVFFNSNFTQANISAVTVSGNYPPFSYAWSNGATTPGVIGLTSTDTYMLTVTDARGCTRVFDVFVNFDCANANMTVANGTGEVQYDAQNFLGEITDVTILGGTPPFTYEWSTGDTGQGIDSLFTSGTYSLTVYDNATCNRDFEWDILLCQDKVFEVAPNSAKITYDLNDHTADISFLFIFGGVGPYSYKWNRGDTTDFLHDITQTGVYSVTATDAQGCSKTFFFDIDNSDYGFGSGNVGLDDLVDEGVFEVAINPNPSNGQFQLEFQSTRSQQVQLEVLNLVGQVVERETLRIRSRQVSPMDLSHLPKGSYLLRLTGADAERTQRIVIH